MSRRSLAIVVLAALVAVSPAQSIRPGLPMPPVKVSAWVKGHPVTSFEKGKTYVFEFWATWCGPCIQAMPHLSELAKKYAGRMEFVGIDVREQGADIPGQVRKFVEGKGDQMAYNVALDDSETMFKTWLLASGGQAIPATFVVDGEGKLLWVGHPMLVAPVLEAIDKGTFDLAKSAADFQVRYTEMRHMYEISDGIKAARALYAEGKKREAVEALEALARKATASDMLQVEMLHWEFKARAEQKATLADLDRLFATDPETGRQIALSLAETFGPTDKKFALAALGRMRKGIEASDPFMAYSLGTSYLDLGQPKDAVKYLELAKKRVGESKDYDAKAKANLIEMIDRSLAKARGA